MKTKSLTFKEDTKSSHNKGGIIFFILPLIVFLLILAIYLMKKFGQKNNAEIVQKRTEEINIYMKKIQNKSEKEIEELRVSTIIKNLSVLRDVYVMNLIKPNHAADIGKIGLIKHILLEEIESIEQKTNKNLKNMNISDDLKEKLIAKLKILNKNIQRLDNYVLGIDYRKIANQISKDILLYISELIEKILKESISDKKSKELLSMSKNIEKILKESKFIPSTNFLDSNKTICELYHEIYIVSATIFLIQGFIRSFDETNKL